MAKEQFVDKVYLSKASNDMIYIVNKIIDDYADQGYRLTLRQLYYQLVSSGIVKNQKSEYKKLSALLVKGRMFGVVDWDAIEDRERTPRLPYWVHDIDNAVNETVEQYRLDRQAGQEVYLELWCEKDALSGVLYPITSYYHIRLMLNRGYSSCSAMYGAYKRFYYYASSENRQLHILYLGDHDPSGLDMVRDIRERLNKFGLLVEVTHIGITMKQIKRYNPPPNPAKVTDPRASWYIAEFGRSSWELDALNPRRLNKLVKSNIEKLIDVELFKNQITKEEEDKKVLRDFIERLEE